MRRLVAILAIFVALVSLPFGFVSDNTVVDALTFGLYSGALLIAGLATLRGTDLIYMAAAWGLYIGMNLAAFANVIGGLSRNAPAFVFEITLLLCFLAVGPAGLVITFIANHRERHG